MLSRSTVGCCRSLSTSTGRRVETRRAHRRVRWPVPGFPQGPQSGSHSHVSASPPLIRYGRISRVPLAAAASPQRTFPHTPRLKHSPAYTPWVDGYTSGSTSLGIGTAHLALRPDGAPTRCPPLTESPFAHWRRYLLWGGVQHLLGRRYPAFFAHTGSCAEPNTSHRLRPRPCRQVLAGCYEPLLVDGPSRRYLHNLCMGAWARTPLRSTGALTCFFPVDVGLHPDMRGLARRIPPRRDCYVGKVSRGCSHSFTFRLPYSLDPLIAPTAASATCGAGRLGRLHHAMNGRLPCRTVASLHARSRQLAWQDFHLLGCGLVGRYTCLNI